MPEQRLFTPSSPLRGRSAAMAWAAERTSGLPHSVLYISPPEVRDETLVDEWDQHGSQLALQTARFDSVVDRLYEHDTHEGQSTYGSQADRQLVIEAALSCITDETHPLYCDGEPSVGLVQQAENVLSLLEFAGLDSHNAVRERLIEVDVDHLADPLAEFTATVHAIHDDVFTRTNTFRGERYLHVINQGNPLAASVFSEVDVVIIGAFQTLSPLERDLLDVLSSVFDTAVVSPRVTPESTPIGVDTTISRISAWYADLGVTPQSTQDAAPQTSSSRSRAAAALYRYADPATEHANELGNAVKIETHPTIRHEVDAIARQVRSLIADGVEPDHLCIAPFDSETYTEQIAHQLRAAEVPVRYDSSRDFFATTTGTLIDAALTLGREPDRQEPLVRLLSNPLVRVGTGSDTESTETIIQHADLVESTRIEVLQSHLDTPARAVVDAVVSACQSFVDSTDPTHARIELLRALAVPVGDRGIEFTDDITLASRVERREKSALAHLARLCESLTTVSADPDSAALRRVLEQVSVETTVGRQSDSVRLCTPTEAVSNPYSHVFVPGLTTEHTPAPPRRPAFARALNESHTDFEAADPIRRTRYLFALLLTSEAELRLSAPERNANGDQYVPADVLDELQRIADIDVDSHQDPDTKPATRDGVHRSIATAIETGGVTPSEIIENAATYDITVPEANTVTRLQNGIRTAAARADPETGPYDGRIEPPVVDGLRSAETPFSPSQLERYAQCGFKYYLGYLLDIEADETISLELDAGAAGTYIHDVFEGFYTEWTAQRDDPLTEATEDDAQQMLYEVAADLLSELAVTETVFHNTWLRSLFDGLAVDQNQYGDPDGTDGLFRRFLTAERELAARDARPTYFEAHVGLSPRDGAGTVLSEEPVDVPGTDVALRGKIDRLDVTADGGIVGFDYKTGNTPTEADTVDGHRFQLPAYLLMAEDVLGGDAVGGSYYQVNPSSSVSYHMGTIGSETHAAHARYGKDDSEPLRRERTLEFDTHEEFDEFLHDVVPTRIEQISTAVTEGSFHPTVLDPSEAGCEYCEYRDVCDVRHHRRHEIRDQLDHDDIPSYTPTTTEVDQ